MPHPLRRRGEEDQDAFGHWWLELDYFESFGWWPKGGISKSAQAIRGVEGVMNDGEGQRDPHHGDYAPRTRLACLNTKDKEGSIQFGIGFSVKCKELKHKYPNSFEGVVKNCIRSAAKWFANHKPPFRWKWPGEYNCHNFQLWLLDACCLRTGPRLTRKERRGYQFIFQAETLGRLFWEPFKNVGESLGWISP